MKFYSNGKLFILGEYFVLEGAKAFALPTKFGQFLDVFPIKTPVISWKSYDHDGKIWFNDDIAIKDIIECRCTSDDKIRQTLIDILHQAHLMNPTVLSENHGFLVETELTFPRNWGLGTSSTLLNNIAQWFDIDAFALLKNSFGGSGYDIACAQNDSPIVYQSQKNYPLVKPVEFTPDFTSHIYFVYLNAKRDSKEAIANFNQKKHKLTDEIALVSEMTDRLLTINDLATWIDFFKTYEQMLSKILDTPTIQAQLFADFDGLVKSLGGWGGDFVMVASEKNPIDYFKNKGFNIILTYDEMILNASK